MSGEVPPGPPAGASSGPPPAPDLWVGRRGTLDGVAVEVLGWAEWRTSDGYVYHEVIVRTDDDVPEWWTLELDEGHVVLARELREEPVPGFSPRGASPGARVALDEMRTAFPEARARLERVEGEYWKDLKRGEEIVYRGFVAGATQLSASREITAPRDEWEWSQGVYLDPRVVERGFEGLSLPRPEAGSVHALRPWPYPAWARALRWAALAGAIVGGLLAAWFGLQPAGDPLFEEQLQITGRTGEEMIGVMDSAEAEIIGIEVAAHGFSNSWGWFEVAIAPVPPEGETAETFDVSALVRTQVEMSRYSGQDADGYWVEEASNATEGFRVGVGSYMVLLGWEIDPLHDPARQPVTLRVRVHTGYRDVMPLLLWAGGCLVLFGLMTWAASAHWRRVLVDADVIDDEDD